MYSLFFQKQFFITGLCDFGNLHGHVQVIKNESPTNDDDFVKSTFQASMSDQTANSFLLGSVK